MRARASVVHSSASTCPGIRLFQTRPPFRKDPLPCVCVCFCTVLHNTKANLVLTRSLTTVATTSEPAKLTRSTLVHCTYRHLFLRQPWPPAARRSEQTSAQMNRYYLVSSNHQICVSCCWNRLQQCDVAIERRKKNNKSFWNLDSLVSAYDKKRNGREK